MSVVHVAASRSYDVLVNEVPLDSLGEVCQAACNPDAVFVVSDSNVAPLYLDRVRHSLAAAGFGEEIPAFMLAAGEQSKTMETLSSCLEAMALAGLTRSSAVVALGGGVVGDLAGFAAASYMRGCHCIQVPTSLLACVDSSVGGKTAVDLAAGKNLAGAFFQPDAVLIDTSLLSTLPEHFFIDGCAEVIKYGVIRDAALFEMLEQPLSSDDSRLGDIVTRCVEIKRDVVQEDERESGMRMLLNFGHTLGHAIERESDYTITHGFAVACGMVLISRAAAKRGMCDSMLPERLSSFLSAYGLPTTTSFSSEQLYEAACSDKKRRGSHIDVVIAQHIGKAFVHSFNLSEFKAFVRDACDEFDCQ